MKMLFSLLGTKQRCFLRESTTAKKGSVFMAPARLAVCWHPPTPTPILSENEKSFFPSEESPSSRFHFAPSHVSSLPWKWTENEMEEEEEDGKGCGI